MTFLKTVAAIALVTWHISLGLIAGVIFRDPIKRRRYHLAAISKHSYLMMKILGMNLEIRNPENLKPEHNYFIVANHMSYLDAITMGAFQPAAFVSSVEMRNTPVLGTIMDTAGCLYVERRNKDNIQNEIGDIEEALKEGFNVTIFPEATTTNGSAVKYFKRPLYAAALRAKKSVLPVVIQYESIDGVPVTAANRNTLCWIDDMTFAPHFMGLVRCRELKFSLTILPEIPVTDADTRDTLMEQSYAAISGHYRPIV